MATLRVTSGARPGMNPAAAPAGSVPTVPATGRVEFRTPGAHTFSWPRGLGEVYVQLVGGGAGGGGGGVGPQAGGGGGGGAYAAGAFTGDPGTDYTVYVGDGAPGGATPSKAAFAGIASKFGGGLFVAAGGLAGAPFSAGGLGGKASASLGDVVHSGGDGAAGVTVTGGGGGGAAGTDEDGHAAVGQTGGTGTDIGGAGGKGGGAAPAANVTTVGGGGGGGGDAGGNLVGATGGNGIVIISWPVPRS